MAEPATKILIVDDDPLNLEILEELLGDDYDLVTAETGEEALEQAREYRPDVVLLDIMMPGIDGYETCRRMRKMPALENAKILLVSAKAMVSERLEGYESGADDYMTKPFNKDELRAKVKVFAKLRRAEEMDELKTRLLRQLEYEVRTPLTGILPAAESLRSELEMSHSDRVDCADMIIDGTRRLVRMVDQCMLLCQLKDGTATFDDREHDFSAIADEALASVEDLVQARQIVVRKQLVEGVNVFGDRRYVLAALQALLQVAMNSIEAGGELEVEVEDGQGQSTLRLRRASFAEIEEHTDETAFSKPLADDVLFHLRGDLDIARANGTWTCTVALPQRAIVSAGAGED